MCVLVQSATGSPFDQSQGWVPVDVIIKHMRSKPSLEELRQVVTENDKVGARCCWAAVDCAQAPSKPSTATMSVP